MGRTTIAAFVFSVSLSQLAFAQGLPPEIPNLGPAVVATQQATAIASTIEISRTTIATEIMNDRAKERSREIDREINAVAIDSRERTLRDRLAQEEKYYPQQAGYAAFGALAAVAGQPIHPSNRVRDLGDPGPEGAAHEAMDVFQQAQSDRAELTRLELEGRTELRTLTSQGRRVTRVFVRESDSGLQPFQDTRHGAAPTVPERPGCPERDCLHAKHPVATPVQKGPNFDGSKSGNNKVDNLPKKKEQNLPKKINRMGLGFDDFIPFLLFGHFLDLLQRALLTLKVKLSGGVPMGVRVGFTAAELTRWNIPNWKPAQR